MGGETTILATAGLLVLCMGLWATALLPEIVTALLFFALAMLLKLGAAATVFSGFASSAFWLVMSGMVVGLAMTRTGLGARLAQGLSGRLSGSYARFIAGLVGFSFLLAFVMPSNLGRIALMIPVTLSLCDAFGLAPGRKGRVGAVMAIGLATPILSAAILPANVPNLVMAGAAERLQGLHLTYLPYLWLHAPVLALVKGALLVLLLVKLFPDRLEAEAAALPA
ncbi:citrate transporter, partial [Methylobacterium sp. WL122]